MLDTDCIPIVLFAWTHAILRGGRGSNTLRQGPALLQDYRSRIDVYNKLLTACTHAHQVRPPKLSRTDAIDRAVSHIGASKVIDAFRLMSASGTTIVDLCLVRHLRELLFLASSSTFGATFREAFWSASIASALCGAAERQQDSVSGPTENTCLLTVSELCCDLLM